VSQQSVGSLWVADKDAEKSKRVMQAMFQMDKIEIEGLKRVYAGE